ncbi:MAG: glycosyltransferase family 39 protein, partial [bacterium]|nr:glycosyltransferase family 39 protein [bacterium]
TVLKNDSNLGFARANNRAIEQATGEYLLLLNPDAEVTSGSIDALIKRADSIKNLGGLAPQLRYPDNTYQPNFYAFPSMRAQLAKLVFREKAKERYIQQGRLVPVDCAWGAALLVPRLINGRRIALDKNIFLYSEDLELCWRLHTQGRRVYVDGAVTFIHAHNKSGEQHFGASRASETRLLEFKKTLRYVTRRYWRGPFKEVRFWLYCQLEALNASWRRLLLATLFKSRFASRPDPQERASRMREHRATARVFSGRTERHQPLTRFESVVVVFSLILFISLALTIAGLLPRGRANDEDSHVTYTRYVADYQRLPDQLAIDFGVNREPHQPPLFYIMGAGWLELVRPLGLGIDSLRTMMILLGLVQMLLVYRLSRLLLPVGWRVVPLMLFAALPMLVHEFATVNNDALSFVLLTVVTIAMLRLWRTNTSAAWYVVAALAGAGAVLTKLFAGPPLLVLGLAITLSARRHNKLRVWFGALVIAAIPVALWLWFNLQTTGYLVPEVHLGELAQLDPYREDVSWNYLLSFFVVLWQTFVGRLGSWDIVYPDLLYVAYLIPIGLAVAGLFRLDQANSHTRRFVHWITGAIVSELFMLAYLNRDYFQPQARYLYPMVAGLLVILTLGLKKTLPLKPAIALLILLGGVSLALTPGIL